jgi:hypothetical protein
MAAGRRRARARRGLAGTALAWPATLAAKRGEPLHAAHLRFRKRAGTPLALHCFVLDCSASMLSHERLALAKGLIVAYFDDAARRRMETALICFGGNGVARRFGPAVPRWWNARWLDPVDGGGGTPLADGIAAASQLLARDARRAPASNAGCGCCPTGARAKRRRDRLPPIMSCSSTSIARRSRSGRADGSPTRGARSGWPRRRCMRRRAAERACGEWCRAVPSGGAAL